MERNYWFAWLVAWLGIALAGGVFGLRLAGVAGFLVGVVIAGVIAAPIVVTVGTLTWAFWLLRFQVAAATIAGACTGTVATFRPPIDGIWWEGEFFVVLAGLLGAMGGGIASYIYWQRRPEATEGKIVWQFSLRDLFLRFAVLAALIAVWLLIVAKIVKTP